MSLDPNRMARVLVQLPPGSGSYSDAWKSMLDKLPASSRKAEIEARRQRYRIWRGRAALLEAEGYPSDEALSLAKELDACFGKENLQYGAIARHLGPDDPEEAAPDLFRFDHTQMQSGICADIVSAIASPGLPVVSLSRTYLRDRRYDASQRLNSYLGAGHNRFRVVYRGEVFEVRKGDGLYDPCPYGKGWIAEALSGEEVRTPLHADAMLLRVTSEELGWFPDIAAAVVEPGRPVPKSIRPYDESAGDYRIGQVNSHIAYRAYRRSSLRVALNGRTYRVRIVLLPGHRPPERLRAPEATK